MRIQSASALLAVALVLACAANAPPEMPPLEPWGDLQRPYGDPVEAAAWVAVGPRSPGITTRNMPPMRLQEFWDLDVEIRALRQATAAKLLVLYVLSHRDSLPFALEAVRIDPSSALAYLEAARLLMVRGGTDRAYALAVQGLRLEPGTASLWGLLAAAYLRHGDGTRARTALERALAIDPKKVPGGYETLATLYLRDGDFTGADSLAKLEKKPNATLILYIDAMRARQRGDLHAARSALEQAARDPDAQTAMIIDWGNVEYELGNLAAAADAYERVLRTSPEEPAALNGQGNVLRARGQLEAATLTFLQLVAERPQDTSARFNLAGTSLDAAQHAGHGAHADSLYVIAEKSFSACIDAKFHASESRQRRAHIRLRLGDVAGAAADARELLADPASATAARLLLARAGLAGGDLRSVVSTLAPQFAADSLSNDGLDLLGNTYLKLDRPDDAARVLDRAHRRQPDDYRTAMNFGVALSRSGKLAAAEALFRALAAQRPDDADVLQNLAAVLQRRGQRPEANRLLRRTARLRAP